MNIENIWQITKQVGGLLYTSVKYESLIPSLSGYDCKADYILPFDGAWVVVNGGVTKEFSHSWDVLTQRYAYDFLILDENAKSYSGDLTKPQSYYCYGADIVAPADGIVVKIETRCENSRIDEKGTAYCDSHDICGNHIIIKHNDDEYSFLAHLMKDSISVEVGNVVRQGQYIAKCGNTGNSSEPHLHFHLQNKQSFFTSIGLPVEFKHILAEPKENYSLFDSRPAQNDFVNISGKMYIGRGQQVTTVNNCPA